MEESFTYQKASASRDEDTGIEPLAKPKKEVSSGREDNEEDVPLSYLKSQINLKEENVPRSNLRPELNLIKEEYHDISLNFDSENGGPVSNPKPEIAMIKVEYDNISFHTGREADLSISNLRPETCLIKEEYDDFSVNPERNLMKEADDTQTGNKQDFIAEADSNTDDEEGELLTIISLNFDSEDDGPISNPKPEIALIKVEYDNISFHTDSEADLSISNLRPETCLIKEEYDDFSVNPETNLMKEDDVTHSGNKKDFAPEADCNTDDEIDEPSTYARLKKHLNIDDDGDDDSINTEYDDNYETEADNGNSSDYEPESDNGNSSDYEPESDNGNSSDYEPEPKRPQLTVPELCGKKNTYLKCSKYIYEKFVIRQCPMCEFEYYNSVNSWKKHLNFVHHIEKPEDLQFKYSKRGAKCKLCDFQMATPSFNKLLDHEITHMRYSQYLKCKLCDWKTKTYQNINFHLRQQHAENLVATKSVERTVCPYCHQEFSSQWYLRRHMIQNHEKSIDSRTLFLCLECDQEFTSKVSLRAHVFEKFSKYTAKELRFEEMPPEGDKSAYLKCTQCPQIFQKIDKKHMQIKIREHYMLHLGEPNGKLAYKCKYCSERCRRYDDIPFHVCEQLLDLLQKEVESKEAPLQNPKMSTNLPLQPVPSKKDYMKHIRHVCLKCGISFSQIWRCKKHMFEKHGLNNAVGLDFKSIDGTEKYECMVCEKFTCDFDLNTMLVHLRSHTMYDPFQCKRCEMTFTYDADIPGHLCMGEEFAKTLNETIPPKGNSLANMEIFCPKCGRTYSSWPCLKRHLYKAHGMDDPYRLGFKVLEKCDDKKAIIYNCTECIGFTITDKDLKAMLEHARQHLPYTSFRCTLCSEQFKFKDEAKQHQCPVNNTTNDADLNKIIERLVKMGRFCPKCGKKFLGAYICKLHITKVHGFDRPDKLGFEKIPNTAESSSPSPSKVAYRCRDCMQFTLPQSDVSAMLEHAREHLPFDSFWCKLCEKRFRLRSEAKLHRCDTSDGGDVERLKCAETFEKCIKKFCPECNNEMPSIKAWRLHMHRNHEMNRLEGLQMKRTNANLVECLVCQMHITHKRRYEHRFLHVPYKPFQCKFCAEYFVEIGKAKMHCAGCKFIPREILAESDEQKAKTPKKRNATKKNNKESEDITDDYNDGVMTCEQSSHKSKTSKCTMHAAQESDSETTGYKDVSVVLTDDNDYAKFVRISCPLCPDTEFETNLALSQHFKEIHNSFLEHFTIHNTNTANCKTCNKYFKDVYKKPMARHYLKEINGTCYSCRLCDKSFLYFTAMRSHILDEHDAIIAGISESTAASSDSISAAKKAAAAGTTSSTAAIVANDGMADSLKITTVDISKVSRTSMAIPTNKTVAFNEFNAYISYACPECNAHFETSEQWHIHINFEHDFFDQHQLNIEDTSDGCKRCTQCNVNINGGVLAEQRHKLTHMQFKSFICTLCLHRSTTIGVLTQHFRRRHFAKGEFKCILCEEVLSTSCEQIEHIKSAHDPSEYPSTLCRVCFNKLGSADALRKHMEMHNPNRVVFPCKFCERSYKYKRELTLHIEAKHKKRLRRGRKRTK